MNNKPRVYTYLKQGNYTFVLCDPQPERPKEMTQPNFMETGLALCKIIKH
jgi:hypothetical protein